MRGIVMAACGSLLALLAGCATAVQAGGGADADQRFTGSWSVRWCDPANPGLECGGFHVDMRQSGDRICGQFAGALVNFRQVDEGDLVGEARGDSAVLEVRSGRNGEITRIQATRVGEGLRWKQIDTIRQGTTDISVIALDDVLERAAVDPDLKPESCPDRS